MNHDRLLAWCGIVGPILFSVVVGILGTARAGYSQVSEAISVLGGIDQPNAIFQVANFFVLGALTIAFAYGLHRGISPSRASTIGAVCVALFGLGVFLAGMFPCKTCIESIRTSADIADIAHLFAATIAFFGFLPAPFLLARGMTADARWHGMSKVLMILGVANIVLLFVFLALSAGPFSGLFQRIYIGSVFLVLEVLAVRLYRLTGDRQSPLHPHEGGRGEIL